MNLNRNCLKMTFKIFLISTFAAMSCSGHLDVTPDEYVQEVQQTCHTERDAYNCLKFKALRLVSGVAEGRIFREQPIGDETMSRAFPDEGAILKFVRISKQMKEENEFKNDSLYLGESRQFGGDSEFDKFWKFSKRQVGVFLKSHGVSFVLPDGARAITKEDEDTQDSDLNEVARGTTHSTHGRGKKKKLAIFLPLLSLLAILKVKLLMVPTLLSVLFIKKVLILSALFLPSLLSTLKVCKMPHPVHHHAAEVSADYSSGYGNYAAANGQTYSKDWAASRAYNAYKPYDKSALKASQGYYIAQGNNAVYPTTA